MSFWRQLAYGMRRLAGKRHEEEIADEVSHFFAEAEAECRERGLSAEEARRAVRREAGSPAHARNYAIGYGWETHVSACGGDLRFAWRQLRRHPVFTVTAVLTLAIGIGANTAIFTVVQRVLLAPLAYKNAGRLAVLETYRGDESITVPRVTGPDAADIGAQAKSLQSVSLYSGGNLGVQLGTHAAYATVTIADENFAHVFSLQPIAGRLFTDGDAHRAAMVSERFARDNYGTAQAAVGQVIHIENEPLEIAGVLSSGFDFPAGTQVWMAAPTKPESDSRTAFNYKAVALLREGTGFHAATTELNVLSDRLEEVYAKENHGKQMRIVPLKQALTGDSRPTLIFLWAAALLILVIVCMNIMHLQLVRSMERQREMAVRKALGSSRWRVMQPVFLESLLLALAGSAAGVLLAFPTVRVLVGMAPKELPRASEIHVNLWVLGFATGLGLLTAVASAMIPALRVAKADPAEALKRDSSRGMARPGAGRLRDGLVMAEVAATFVLAVSAGLLLRTMMTLHTRDMGYRAHQMLVVDADAPAHGEAESLRTVAVFNQLFTTLGTLPGVQRAAGIMGLPTGSYGSDGNYETRGGLPANPRHPAWANFSVTSPGYFQTMEIPLKQGREFAPEDTHESAPVAVISEALARESFGAQDPVGRQIRCGLDSDKWMTVVGVAGNVRQASPTEAPGPTLYMPMTQHPFYANQIHIVLRTAVKPLSLISTVDARIAQANPAIARRYTTMDAMLDTSVAAERFRAALVSSFAGIGVLLAMLGVYGTVAHSAAQRRFEFSLRMAFGAERSMILRLVLWQALKLACGGIAIGLALSLALTRFMQSMLVGVSATNPLNLGVTAALLVATALAAGLAPGWNATRMSPMTTLRTD